MAEFEQDGEADFSYAIPGVARFRVNTFKQRGAISISSQPRMRKARSSIRNS